MGNIRLLDMLVILVYFGGIAAAGIYFSRRNKNTEDYFLGGRNFPGWVIGLSLVGTSISSLTFMAYPGDGYKTAWLRLAGAFTMPIGIFIASRWFLPFYRRTKTTSAYEYLERRFGPGTRLYTSIVFVVMQVFRLGSILFLLSLLLETVTGWDSVTCIIVGGVFVSFYTVLGGIEAVIWTDVVQTIVLVGGGLACLVFITWRVDGGLITVVKECFSDGKYRFAETVINTDVTYQGKDTDWGSILSFQETSWKLTLYQKTALMMLILGLQNWLFEYSGNQMVIQRYCASKSPKEARKAMWFCCLASVPIWTYFMFLGGAMYVYFKHFPNPEAFDILMGYNDHSAEEILPFFVLKFLPAGLSGLVVAAVLAAAMSSLDSSLNSIATVSIHDIYRRHLVKDRDERHYLVAARWVAVVASVLMLASAYWLTTMDMKTFQDTGIILAALMGGGIFGIFMLGFFVPMGDGRAIFWGVVATTAYTLWRGGITLEWWAGPEGHHWYFTDDYYTGLLANLIAFLVGFFVAGIIQLIKKEKRDWTNLTVWTQDGEELQ
jgi:solute:Na+ symporter, SSS family